MSELLTELTKGLEAIEFNPLCDYVAEHTPFENTTLFFYQRHWPLANERRIEEIKRLHNDDRGFEDFLAELRTNDIHDQEAALLSALKKWGANGDLIVFARPSSSRTHELLPRSAWLFAQFDMKTRVLSIGDQSEFVEPVFFLTDNVPRVHPLSSAVQRANEPDSGLSTAQANENSAASGPAFTPMKSGMPGRPTSKHLVKMEFERRVLAGHLESSLRMQAIVLEGWLRGNHPNAPPMTVKTIENNLRVAYKRATKAAAEKAPK